MTDSITLLQDSVSSLQMQLLQVQDSVSADSASIGIIRGYVEKFAYEGGFDLWDWAAIIIAILSLFIALAMAIWQKRTERNTMKITKEGQIGLLVDYVRHFYTNLVVTVAVTEKLGGRFSTHYPSQEHFRKLALYLEALHPEAFFHSKEKYEVVHKLLLLLRNYNIEVGVAEEHVCTRSVIAEAKDRDLNTLIFKPELFCKSFIDCIRRLSDKSYPLRVRLCRKFSVLGHIEKIFTFCGSDKESRYIFDDYLQQIRKSIVTEALGRTKFTDEIMSIKDEDESERRKIDIIRRQARGLKPYYSPASSYFANLIFPDDEGLFFDLVNHNIHTEIKSNNSQGYPKIFIIPFDE